MELEKPTLIEMAQTLSTSTKEANVEQLLTTVPFHDKIAPGVIWKALKATLLSSETLLGRKVLILVATSFTSGTDYFLTEFHLLLEELRGLLFLKCLFVCEVNHVLKETTISVFRGEQYIEIFEECLQSLYFDNTRYSKIAEEHQHTLDWIWKHPSYIKWSEPNTSQLLYIEGKPGSGKSTLAKYFRKNFRPPKDTSIVCRFFYSEGRVLVKQAI